MKQNFDTMGITTRRLCDMIHRNRLFYSQKHSHSGKRFSREMLISTASQRQAAKKRLARIRATWQFYRTRD